MSVQKNTHRLSGSRDNQQRRADWDCLLKDVLKQWWLILLAAAAAALFAGAVLQFTYKPQYTSETTFVIGRSGFNSNTVVGNLQQAETTTKQYTQVVSSSLLQKQVCEDLGMSWFDVSVKVETVPSSNLMQLSVTADSPRKAYLVGRSIIDNAVELMSYFLSGVTMLELEEAEVSEKPSNPMQLSLYMQRAGIIAAGLMILLIGILSYYKDTIKNEGDVSAKVDTKLLGTIGYEKKRKAAISKKNYKRGSLLLNNPLLSFSYVETYRMLATRVRMLMDRNQLQVLMVTSVSENEGKSTVAANIAVGMAQEGKRVLLIDCDFRKPAQYKIFEIDNLEGRDFCEAIESKNNVKVGHVKNLPGLYTLFSKKNKSIPWDSTSFQYLSQVVNSMKRRVDYIILDTSPMAYVADTEEYALLADASILVIRQDVVEACYINDAVDSLEETNAKLLGCVLNGVRKGLIARTSEYGHYNSDYGRYSHYSKVQGGK